MTHPMAEKLRPENYDGDIPLTAVLRGAADEFASIGSEMVAKALSEAAAELDRQAERIKELERDIAFIKTERTLMIELHDQERRKVRALETAEAEMLERATLSLTVKVPAESEVDKAFDSNDFETRKLAMAVRMVCGKILAEKAAAIRALPLTTEVKQP